MLVLIFGNLGKGKTLLLTILGKLWSKEFKIISNYNLGFKFEKLDNHKFAKSEYNNGVILIDELYTLIDARSSMSNENKLLSHLLFQSRKEKLHIFASLQLTETIDLRYRKLIDILIFSKGKFLKHPKGWITINPYATKEQLYPYRKYIYYKYIISEKDVLDREIYLPYEIALRFYECYDTYQVIKSLHQEEWSNLFLTPNDYRDKVDDTVKKIFEKMKDKKRITHNDIVVYLFDNGLSKIFKEKIVYHKVQQLKTKYDESK